MAASTVFAVAAASAVAAPAVDASRLSSGNAFRSTTSSVQLAPVSCRKMGGVVAARAGWSEEKTVGKQVLVSILAAGAALNVAGGALAFENPFAGAKTQVEEIVAGAKDAAPSLEAPSLPTLPSSGALEGFGSSAGDALDSAKESIGGTVEKNKPVVGGGAIEDATKRFSSFGKNPIAENIEKSTSNVQSGAKQIIGEKSGGLLAASDPRVEEATKKVEDLGASFQKKSSDTLKEGEGYLGQVQSATPDLPSTPSLPEIPKPDTSFFGGFPDLTGAVQTKVDEAKSLLPQ